MTSPLHESRNEAAEFPEVEGPLPEAVEEVIRSIPPYVGVTGDALRLVIRQALYADRAARSETAASAEPRCSCYVLPHADDCALLAGITQDGRRVYAEEGGWISVKDALPPRAEAVLVTMCEPDEQEPYTEFAEIRGDGEWYQVGESRIVSKFITHWQHAPAPCVPTETKERT